MADELRIIHLNKFLGDTYDFHVRNVTEQFMLDSNYPDKGLPSVYLEEFDSPAPKSLHTPKKLTEQNCRHSSGHVFLIESGRNSYRYRLKYQIKI